MGIQPSKGEENLLIPVHAYPVIDDLHIPAHIDLAAVPLGQRCVGFGDPQTPRVASVSLCSSRLSLPPCIKNASFFSLLSSAFSVSFLWDAAVPSISSSRCCSSSHTRLSPSSLSQVPFEPSIRMHDESMDVNKSTIVEGIYLWIGRTWLDKQKARRSRKASSQPLPCVVRYISPNGGWSEECVWFPHGDKKQHSRSGRHQNRCRKGARDLDHSWRFSWNETKRHKGSCRLRKSLPPFKRAEPHSPTMIWKLFCGVVCV